MFSMKKDTPFHWKQKYRNLFLSICQNVWLRISSTKLSVDNFVFNETERHFSSATFCFCSWLPTSGLTIRNRAFAGPITQYGWKANFQLKVKLMRGKHSGANVVQLFTDVIYNCLWKATVFVPGRPCVMFASKGY